MRNELENISRIESYLTGTMSNEEKTNFEQQIQNDLNLAQDVKDQQTLTQALQQLYLHQAATKAKQHFITQQILTYAAITISVLLAVCAAWMLLNQKQQKETLQPQAKTDFIQTTPAQTPDSLVNAAFQTDSLSVIPSQKNDYSKQALPPYPINPAMTPPVVPENPTVKPLSEEALKTQVFEISGARDTFIQGEQGLVMMIPAGSFTDATGKTLKDNIRLELKEALDARSIMMAGLNTMAGKEQLETAGMFKLTALHKGQEAKLNKQGILVHLPQANPKPGMMLFEGKTDAQGNIDWTNPKPLENWMIETDMSLLNFYPPRYLETLAGMKMDIRNKKTTDSLYLSFENRPGAGDVPDMRVIYDTEVVDTAVNFKKVQIIRNNSGGFAIKPVTKKRKMDKPIEKRKQPNQTIPKTYNGISPSKVLSIWDKKFAGTYISTRAFEARLALIHQTCNNQVLDVYLKGIGGNLYEADKKAAALLSGNLKEKFEAFAAEKLTNVQHANKLANMLNEYYNTQSKLYKQAAEKTWKKLMEQRAAEERTFATANAAQQQRDRKREASNLNDEMMVNLEYAYKEANFPKPNYAMKVYNEINNQGTQQRNEWAYLNTRLKSSGYTMRVNQLYWCNIDSYVNNISSILKGRSTKQLTQIGGKTVTFQYEPLRINLATKDSFDQVAVYLLPDKVNSFMRMKGNGRNFSEQMNMQMNHRVVCIGWKGKQAYYASATDVKPGEQTLSPQPVNADELDKLLNSVASSKQHADMKTDLAYQEFTITYKQQQEAWNKAAKLRENLWPVVYPCAANLGAEIQEVPTIKKERVFKDGP